MSLSQTDLLNREEKPEKEEALKYDHMMCGLDVLAHVWFSAKERARQRECSFPPHFSRNGNLTMIYLHKRDLAAAICKKNLFQEQIKSCCFL